MIAAPIVTIALEARRRRLHERHAAGVVAGWLAPNVNYQLASPTPCPTHGDATPDGLSQPSGAAGTGPGPRPRGEVTPPPASPVPAAPSSRRRRARSGGVASTFLSRLLAGSSLSWR